MTEVKEPKREEGGKYLLWIGGIFLLLGVIMFLVLRGEAGLTSLIQFGIYGVLCLTIGFFVNRSQESNYQKALKKAVSSDKQGTKSFTEKDNLGTYYDTTSRGLAYWDTRMRQGPDYPFVIYYFDSEKNAREALLELPCVHVAQDSQRLICTEVLDFGCYQTSNGPYAGFICGKDLTHELWEQAKTSFAKHNGTRRNEQEPEKRSPHIQTATTARPDKVVFDREERKFMKDQGVDAIYKFYKAPDAASAKAFLQQNPITKQFYYIGVETPEGNYGSDIQGIYSY